MLSFGETLELMRIGLEEVEGTQILFGVCDDTVLRDYVVSELRKRLPPEITLRDFRYDSEHISLLEGAVEATASGNGRPAVSVTGFETLPRDKRTEAIRLLNWERGRFGYTGIAVILWVNRATLVEISTKSADFYSWRSGTYFIEPPPGWDTLESARRSYLQALMAQNEFVNLQGLAPTRGGQIVQMRMEDIFIPPQVEQEVKLLERLSIDNPRLLLSGTEEGPKEDREPLEELPAAERQVRERQAHESYREIKTRHVEIPELLQERQAVILGDPGAGKTTLLRYLAYTLAHRQLTNGQSEIVKTTPELTDCLPVYIRVGEYAQHLQHHPEATLDTFAPLSCQARQLPLSDELLKDAMDRGQVLFLLDGMDEIIATDRRREVAQRVEEFARNHQHCRLLVTSRIVGYREAQLSGGFAQFTIRPFEGPEIRLFARNWYAALQEPESNAEKLVQAIQDTPSVRRLASNPLLLTVIALIHWRGTKLPHHRAKLYGQAAETLVDQWMSHRRVNPEGWDVQETLQVLLPAVAWHLHSTTSSGLIGEQDLHHLLVETLRQHEPRLSEEAHTRASQFRRNVSEFSGIFLERGLDQDGRGLYGFLHLTFEEYFAALRLVDTWEREADKGKREGTLVLKPLLHDPRWTEVILLTAGRLSEFSQYRATRFVEAILKAQSEYEKILHRDLLLAARCLGDDVRVDADVRRKILSKLLKIYFDVQSPNALREDVGKIITRLGGTAIEKEVLAVVTERLTDPEEDVRRAAAWALGQVGAGVATPEVLVALRKCLTDPGWNVREAAAEALGRLGAGAATPEVVTALLKCLTDREEAVREAVAWTLGQMGQAAATPEVISALRKLLADDPEGWVRRSAAEALEQLGQALATQAILSALRIRLVHSDWEVREEAALVIGKLGKFAATPEILSMLRRRLTDLDWHVRRAAAWAVGGLGQVGVDSEIPLVLVKLLTDLDWRVRTAAAAAVGRLGQEAATPDTLVMLHRCLDDIEWRVRVAAAEALGYLATGTVTPEVRMTLCKCLTARDWVVRQAAAEALGHLGARTATPEVLRTLFKLLTDPQEYVRRAAARALRNLSVSVQPDDRSQMVELFLPLTRSRDEENRETGYVGLRNLLAAGHESPSSP
jgi:HEAT repeat protein